MRNLLPRLRDEAFTRIFLITLPEATPVHEAERLQADLRRAGIEPFAWVVNQSLAVVSTEDPLLAARGRRELPYIEEVVEQHASRAALLPWSADEPAGPAALHRLLHADALSEAGQL